MKAVYTYSQNRKYFYEPIWIVRNGTSMVFIFFIFSLFAATFFPLNEVVSGSVVISSTNPPAHIIAPHSGMIFKINYKSGDSVQKGNVLAELEQNAVVSDVLFLNNQLKNQFTHIQSSELLYTEFPISLNLTPEIQGNYNSFLNSFHKLILTQTAGDYEIKTAQAVKYLSNQQLAVQNKIIELTIAERNLEVQEIHFNRYKMLFQKGIVSQIDLEGVEREVLSARREYYIIKQEYNELLVAQSNFQNNLQLNSNEFIRAKNSQQLDLEFSRLVLLKSISIWENNLLLKSPIDGRLSIMEHWGEFQNLSKGDVVFTVVPFTEQNYIGKCMIPLKNAGRLEIGQRVNLKLDNYPYRDWGMVKAKVKSISETPKPGKHPSYIVYLDIPEFKSTYGKDLKFQQELIGTADILLRQETLMKRIFTRFRQLWSTDDY